MSSNDLRELGLKQHQAQELALAEARKKALEAAKAGTSTYQMQVICRLCP